MTEPTERHHEMARQLIETVKPANLRIRIAEMLAAAHEEGRHEERERCAQVVLGWEGFSTNIGVHRMIRSIADHIRSGE